MTSLFTIAHLPSGADAGLQILFDVAIKSLLILLLAKAVIALLRRSSASARHLAWSVVVCALLVLPILTLWLPGVGLPVLPTLIANTAANATVNESSGSQAGDLETASSASGDLYLQSSNDTEVAGKGVLQESPGKADKEALADNDLLPPIAVIPDENLFQKSAVASVKSSANFSWALVLLAVWLIGVLAVTGRFLFGFIKMWHIARRSSRVTEISWVTLAKSISNRLGMKNSLRVLQSDRVVLPMTWGALRPVILLPEASEDWSLKCRSIVLLHELAHVKRRDCLTQTLAQLACALYWFNPLVWVAARSLRVERELACDDEVLQAGTRASDYAGYLVEIASSFGANVCVSPFAVGMACSELENRVRAILNPERKRATNNRRKVVLSSMVAATILIPLATVQPWTQASTIDEKSRRVQASGETPLVEPNQEHLLSESITTNDRELFRSLDSIKASLQTAEPAGTHTESKDQHQATDTAIAQTLIQPAVLSDGQGVGEGQSVGAGQGMGAGPSVGAGQGTGLGGGQGSGSGSGQGLGDGSGQGLGGGSGLGTGAGTAAVGQGEKSSKDLTPNEIVKLRLYNVTPEYIETVRKMGFVNVSVDQLVQLKINNVDQDYANQIRSWGFVTPTINELVTLKIAGVTADYVVSMKAAGGEQPTIRQLINLKMSKVTSEYIETLRRAGFDKLSFNQLVSLRHQNIDQEFIKQAESWAGTKLTLNQLMQIKIHNLTPAYANEIKALGFDDVSFTRLLELRIHGINSDYVREMRSLGFDNLTLDQLLRMKIHGVTADYVRKVWAAGFKNVSLNQLIEMKMHGLDEILLKNSK
jgi:beta-lactamase regulating signal transducer with metallopeptidase domain